MQNLMEKKKYKVNWKEQKQSMNGVSELTSEAVLEMHVNITD